MGRNGSAKRRSRSQFQNDQTGWESETRRIPIYVEPTHILELTVHNAVYAITTDILYRVVIPVAKVIRIVIRQRSVESVALKVKAYVEVSTVQGAIAIMSLLNGANIYDNCCTLEFAYAPRGLMSLNVIKNDDDTWDYTKSLLPIPVYECPTSPETDGTSSNGRKRRSYSSSSHDHPIPQKKSRVKSENLEDLDPWPGYQAAAEGFEPFQESFTADRQAFYSPEYVPIGQSQVNLPGPTVDLEGRNSSSNTPEAQPSGYVDLNNQTEAEAWREDQQERGHHEVNQDPRDSVYIERDENLNSRWNRSGDVGNHWSSPTRSNNFTDSDFSSVNISNYGATYLESATNLDGRVLIVYNLPELMDPAKVFNLLGVYGDVIRIKFLVKYPGSALVEMSDSDAAWRVINNLNAIDVLGHQISIRMTNQKCIFNSRYRHLLHNGAESYFDFSGSVLHRFSSPIEATKNRIVSPGNVIHFFNLTKEVDRPDKLEEVLFGCHVPEPPLKIQFIKSSSSPNGKSNSGHLEFSSVKDSVAAMVLANNTMINPANGPGRVLKLCFSAHKPPFNNQGVK